MLQFSDLTIETAVANRSEAMDARDHFKNGASSKSHTSRGSFLLVFTVLLMVTFSIVACGGGGSKGSKIPNGTYIWELSSEDFFTFSGNKFTFEGFNHFSRGKGTYEFGRTEKGEDMIVFTYENASVIRYSYTSVENKLWISGRLFVKQ